jgi:hypothetical protein
MRGLVRERWRGAFFSAPLTFHLILFIQQRYIFAELAANQLSIFCSSKTMRHHQFASYLKLLLWAHVSFRQRKIIIRFAFFSYTKLCF